MTRKIRSTEYDVLLVAMFLVTFVGVIIWFLQVVNLMLLTPNSTEELFFPARTLDTFQGTSQVTKIFNAQMRHLLDRKQDISLRMTLDLTKDEKYDVNHLKSFNAISSNSNVWVKFSKIKLNGSFHKSKTLRIDCRRRKLATFSEDILCKKPKKILPHFKNPCWYEGADNLLKCLPYFHIFGVCKSGTTDLFHRITHHPEILKNKGILGKETWYWSWRRYGNGIMPGGAMYLSQFSNLFDSEAISQGTTTNSDGLPYHNLITGHGEPMDFWDQSNWRLIPQNDPEGEEPNITTPYLIRYVNQHIRLILLLRNPIDRLYTHYVHGNYGNSSDQFHQDVISTMKFLQQCQTSRTLRSCLYDKRNKDNFKVPISASLYHVHLQEWLKVFPRKQLLIIRSEDYRSGIGPTIQRVFKFLDVASLSPDELASISALPYQYHTIKKDVIGPMRRKTRALLRNYFRESIQKVADILQDNKYLDWL